MFVWTLAKGRTRAPALLGSACGRAPVTHKLRVVTNMTKSGSVIPLDFYYTIHLPSNYIKRRDWLLNDTRFKSLAVASGV